MQQLTSAGQSTISGSHTYHNVKNTSAGRNNLYRSRCTSTCRSVCQAPRCSVVGVITYLIFFFCLIISSYYTLCLLFINYLHISSALLSSCPLSEAISLIGGVHQLLSMVLKICFEEMVSNACTYIYLSQNC